MTFDVTLCHGLYYHSPDGSAKALALKASDCGCAWRQGLSGDEGKVRVLEWAPIQND